MAQRPGIIRTIFNNLKKTVTIVKQKEHFVGEDHLGNRYYEKIVDPDKQLKGQRRVEPRNPDQFEVPDVPVEWMTWLQGRKANPPTVEEIEKNYITMAKTQYRAKDLEAKSEEDNDSESAIQDADVKPTGRNFPMYKGFEAAPGELRKYDRDKTKDNY